MGKEKYNSLKNVLIELIDDEITETAKDILEKIVKEGKKGIIVSEELYQIAFEKEYFAESLLEQAGLISREREIHFMEPTQVTSKVTPKGTQVYRIISKSSL